MLGHHPGLHLGNRCRYPTLQGSGRNDQKRIETGCCQGTMGCRVHPTLSERETRSVPWRPRRKCTPSVETFSLPRLQTKTYDDCRSKPFVYPDDHCVQQGLGRVPRLLPPDCTYHIDVVLGKHGRPHYRLVHLPRRQDGGGESVDGLVVSSETGQGTGDANINLPCMINKDHGECIDHPIASHTQQRENGKDLGGGGTPHQGVYESKSVQQCGINTYSGPGITQVRVHNGGRYDALFARLPRDCPPDTENHIEATRQYSVMNIFSCRLLQNEHGILAQARPCATQQDATISNDRSSNIDCLRPASTASTASTDGYLGEYGQAI